MQQIRDEAIAILRQLPHWPHVAARVENWMEQHGESATDPLRLSTYASACAYFDARDLAVLIQNLNGIYSEHGSARDVCARKLLLTRYEMPPVEIRRCMATEADHLQLFLDKHRPVGAVIDTQSECEANSYEEDWMRFGQSRIIRIENGARLLVAFEAPIGIDPRTDFRSIVQLHADALIAQRAGIQIDGFALSKLDMKTWEITAISIESKPKLIEEIKKAGDHHWFECVQKDVLPEAVAKPDLSVTVATEDQATRLLDMADNAALFKLIGDAAYGHFKALENGLRQELDRHHIGTATVHIRALKVESTEKLDAESAIAALGDRAGAAQVSGQQDHSLLAKMIKEDPALNIGHFLSNDYRFLLGRSAKLTQFRDRLSDEVADLFKKNLDTLKSVDDLGAPKIVPATEIATKPARKLAPS